MKHPEFLGGSLFQFAFDCSDALPRRAASAIDISPEMTERTSRICLQQRKQKDVPRKALLSAARGGRLNAHRTEKVLKEIANRIKEQLILEHESALNDLHVRFAQEKEKIAELERKRGRETAMLAPSKQVPEPAVQATPTADAPKCFYGLGPKKTDLARYFDAADLTDRQRECASLKWEYGLPDRQIADRLDLHHKTVQESLNAAKKRLERDEKFKQALKRRAAQRGSHDESD